MRKPPLWKYDEENEAEISTWLDEWLNRDFSPAGLLTTLWLYGEATPDSNWTRDKELQEWIDASENHFRAWDGLQHLLRTLRQNEQPITVPLLLWALDVADGTREPPNRPRGRDAKENHYRDLAIVAAIHALNAGDLPEFSNTEESVIELVAKKVGLSYEAVRTIWLKRRKSYLRDYLLRWDRGF